MMTIYTVEIGSIEGGSLALATSDKLEAYRFAKASLSRLIVSMSLVNRAIRRSHNPKLRAESFTHSALFVDKVAKFVGVTWYVENDYISFKIWK